MPTRVRPVSKTMWLDPLDAELGLAGDSFPVQVEGMTWGPTMADGTRVLVVTSDSGFESTTSANVFFVFAVDASPR